MDNSQDRWKKLEEIVRLIVREECQRISEQILAVVEKRKITFVNGKWVGISKIQREAWEASCGAVDIDEELNKAASWLLANPKSNPKSEVGRFLNAWLSRAQNQASLRAIPTSPQLKISPPNLCAYCQSPNVTGSCNGYRHCQEHADDALYGKKPGFMPGVVAKPVSGS